MQVIQCDACAGSVVYDADREVARCLFCGSVAVRPEELTSIPTPDAAIPFKIDRERAEAEFRQWARSSWWYAKEVRQLEVGLTDAMLPAWRFDAGLETHWAGLRSAPTKSGKRPISGVATTTGSTMVPASIGLSPAELDALAPFQLTAAQPWAADNAGVAYELPSTTERAAESTARRRLLDQHRSTISSRERVGQCRASAIIELQASELLMLPIWIGSFRYRDLPWRFVVNAQTGKVTGRAPLDRVKVALAITAAVAVAALILWWQYSRGPG